MSWAFVDHSAYSELQVGAGCLALVSGLPSAGKSTFACRLADSVSGPVLYIASEEGISPTMSARLLRCGVKRDDFLIVTRASCDQAVGFIEKHGAVVAVLDSAQESAWSPRELRHVLEIAPKLQLLIAVMQSIKDGSPAGAQTYYHEADVHVAVAAGGWNLRKSRYQDLSGVGGDVLPRPQSEVA